MELLPASPRSAARRSYADGGTRAQVFFESGLLPRLPEVSHTNLTLYVIVTGKLSMETNCVNDCLKDLTLRTLDMLLDANAIGDLYHIKYELDRIGFGKFRLARIWLGNRRSG